MEVKFSQDIAVLVNRLARHPLTLQEILAETQERGFCLTIGLLVLPFLLPMPPGVSTILGTGCLLLSLQMAVGRRTPWLPKRVARFQFPRVLSQAILGILGRLTKILEKFVRPRYRRIALHPSVWQINGACMAWLTFLLMLPIPMTNPLPSIGILLLAIATLEGDGLLMGIGYIWTGLNTLIFGGIGYALWQIPQALPDIFR